MVNTKNLLIIALGVIFVVLFFYSIQKPIYQDEGVFLEISNGIMNGDLPYVDYFDHKTPAIYIFLLPAVIIIGKKIIFLNILFGILNIITAVFIFKISEIIRKGSGLLASMLFLCTTIFFEGNYIIAETFIALIISIILYLLFGNKKFLLIGGLSSLLLLTKQTMILSFVPLIYYIRNNIVKVRLFTIGYFCLLIVTIIFMIFIGFNESFNQIITVNFGSYPREAIVKVVSGFKGSFSHTWPIWLLSIIGYSSIKNKDIRVLFSGLLLTTIPFFFVRHYSHYWVSILPIIAIMSSLGFERLKSWGKSVELLTATIVVVVFVLSSSWYVWISNNIDKPKRLEQIEATKYIDNLKPKYILCENQFTGFYYLSEKDNLSNYIYLTEVNESENAEEIVIEELKRNNSIILWPQNENYAYAKNLQKYIVENYRPIKQYSNLEMTVYTK